MSIINVDVIWSKQTYDDIIFEDGQIVIENGEIWLKGRLTFADWRVFCGAYPANVDFLTDFKKCMHFKNANVDGRKVRINVKSAYILRRHSINYLKGFTEPIPVFTPMNFISEFSLPVSMAFRHYGNVMCGAVISVLIGTALRGLSKTLLGAIPLIGNIPLLQVGLPAILSIYFDVFSGLMQAFIFAMLTMLNVSGAFPQEAWEKRQKKKEIRKQRAALAKA